MITLSLQFIWGLGNVLRYFTEVFYYFTCSPKTALKLLLYTAKDYTEEKTHIIYMFCF